MYFQHKFNNSFLCVDVHTEQISYEISNDRARVLELLSEALARAILSTDTTTSASAASLSQTPVVQVRFKKKISLLSYFREREELSFFVACVACLRALFTERLRAAW